MVKDSSYPIVLFWDGFGTISGQFCEKCEQISMRPENRLLLYELNFFTFYLLIVEDFLLNRNSSKNQIDITHFFLWSMLFQRAELMFVDITD